MRNDFRLDQNLILSGNPREVAPEALQALYDMASGFETPENYMRRIVDRIDPLDPLADNQPSLELRILRRILKTVFVPGMDGILKNCYSQNLQQLLDEHTHGDVIDVSFIGEDFFTAPIITQVDCKKLINGCSDLAHGRSSNEGVTKGCLFLFAFAYGMKYYSLPEEDGYDPKLDVEKNLFTDYCGALFNQALLGRNNYKNLGGISINPKNFVDALFVYYLNRDDLTPKERITSFCRLVASIKDRHRPSRSADSLAVTQTFRENLTIIQEKSDQPAPENGVSPLEAFILDNYDCGFKHRFSKEDRAYVHHKSHEGTFIFNPKALRSFISANGLMDKKKCILEVNGKKILLAVEVHTNQDADVNDPNVVNFPVNDVMFGELFAYHQQKNRYYCRNTSDVGKYFNKDENNNKRYCLKDSIVDLLARELMLQDHICLVSLGGEKSMILAIEVNASVEKNQLNENVFGSEYFVYENGVYLVSNNAPAEREKCYSKNGSFYFFNNNTFKLDLFEEDQQANEPTNGLNDSPRGEDEEIELPHAHYTVINKYGKRFLASVRAYPPQDPSRVNNFNTAFSANAILNATRNRPRAENTDGQTLANLPEELSEAAHMIEDSSIIGTRFFTYNQTSDRLEVPDDSKWSTCYKNKDNDYTYYDPCFNILVNSLPLCDHACVMEINETKLLYAIETDKTVETNCLGEDVLGSEFFEFDQDRKVYRKKSGCRAGLYVYSEVSDLYFFGGDVYTVLSHGNLFPDNILLGEISDRKVILAINAPDQTSPHAYIPNSANLLTDQQIGSEYFDYDEAKRAYITCVDRDKNYQLIDHSHYAYLAKIPENGDIQRPENAPRSCLLQHQDTPLWLEVETEKRKKPRSNNAVTPLEQNDVGYLFCFDPKEHYYSLSKIIRPQHDGQVYKPVANSISSIENRSVKYGATRDGKIEIDVGDPHPKLALEDHVCIVEINGQKILAAIEVKTEENKTTYGRVRYNRLDPSIIGSEYFVCSRQAYQLATPPSEPVSETTKGVMELSRPIRTAYKLYEDILSWISSALFESSELPVQNLINRDNRFALATDTTYEEFDVRAAYERICQNAPQIESFLKKYECMLPNGIARQDFESVLERIMIMLSPGEALGITKSSKVTRHALIAAYYHCYLLNKEKNGTKPEFAKVYKEFCDDLDEFLIDAGYACISPKNLFDMTVILIAYLYINDVFGR